MPSAEDIPQPENGFYVLVTGANRYENFINACNLAPLISVQWLRIGHWKTPD
jgi:hypothetical protein